MDYEKAEAEVVTTENEDIISTSELSFGECTRGNNGAMGNSGAHRNCNHKPSTPSY